MAGVVGGGLAGFWIGERVHGERRAYWLLNVAVVLGCALLDFAGLAFGRYWLAYSAVGLMGGLITGMKYGYSDAMRIWRAADPAKPAETPVAESSADPTAESPVESSSPRT